MTVANGELKLYDPQEDGALVPSIDGVVRKGICVAYSSCGRWLVSEDSFGEMRLRDRRCNDMAGKEEQMLKCHTTEMRGLTSSPSGRQLASCSSDGAVYLRV